MRVLFISPLLPPHYAKAFNQRDTPYGGWIDGCIRALTEYTDLDLSLAMIVKEKENWHQEKKINRVSCHVIHYSSLNYLKEQLSGRAEVYQIFGSEAEYIRDCIQVLDLKRLVIHIQGVLYNYFYHYDACYNSYDKIGFFFKFYMELNKKIFKKRAIREMEILKLSKNFIIRTDFDTASVLQVNPEASIYCCQECIRESFYNAEKWNFEKIEKHRIYVSQGNYSIKGMHLMIHCICEVKRKFPDVRCYVGGENILESKSIATRLGVSYAALIKKQIKKYHLEDNIIYLGEQNEREVVEQLQKAHVFLLGSSVENSPNSLAEAMLLGVPCVASFVGGISSLVNHGIEAFLYPYDAPYLAASYIIKIFENRALAEELSFQAGLRSVKLYDRQEIAMNLQNIYQDILYRIVKESL